MSELGELPLLVLGLGLLAGGVVALLVARRSTRQTAAARSDLDLRIEDLEAQRDELYARLRGGEGTELGSADRNELELAAARVLRELDSLHEQRGSSGALRPSGARGASAAAQPATPAASTSFGSRHPGLVGALLGGGMVGLVALLVFWAQRDAVPAPEQPMASAPAPGAGGGELDRGEPSMPPQVASRVQALRDRLVAAPTDLAARRDLAQLLMSHEQFFDAFQEAQQILAQASEDPVGNYVSGIVRYTMGQPEDALVLLGRALAGDPTLSQAALMRGLIQLQLEDREGAMATWEQGLQAIGGSHPVLEHVLGLAREGRSAQEIMSTPPPAGG
jgi:tetratricopeptide (TPR) repeat protein